MLLSVHVPKTAGSTLKAILRRVYGPNIHFDYQDQYGFVDPMPPTLGIRLRRSVKGLRYRRKLRPTDRCIHGHFRARKYLADFPDHRLMTWLRDPVERVASHYDHWRRHPDLAHSVCRRLIRERLTLVQFAEIDMMRNLQSRYLDGLALDVFDFVGIQEQFDRMLPSLFEFLGAAPLAVRARNVSPAKAPAGRYPLDPDSRRTLKALNAEDCALYAAAIGRLRVANPA